MRNIFSLIICLFVFVLPASGQREGYIWPWNGGMIDFNAGPPAFAIGIGAYNIPSAAICGPAGNLLFYADGNRIYNRTGSPMPYGLLTGLGGANCVSIAPDPSNKYRYYVFSLTTPYQLGGSDTATLYYSLVDMRLRGGLGDVIPEQRNVLVETNLIQHGLTVIKGNDCNIWIVVHEKKVNNFKAFELSSAGLNMTPVISPGASVIPFFYKSPDVNIAPTGCKIKANSTNNTIAFGVTQRLGGLNGYVGAKILELYSFDNNTGIINNPIQLVYDTVSKFNAVMDFCFSPDNSKLYYSWRPSWFGMGPAGINQFNLSLPTAAAIIGSEVFISIGATAIDGALKTGPDGRIYAVKGYEGFIIGGTGEGLYYIALPNLAGTACLFVNNNLLFSTISRGEHFPSDIVVLPRDTVTSTSAMCVAADSIVLPAYTSGSNYIWWDSSTVSSRVIDTPGTYYVQYQTGCTDHFDTFVVSFQKLPLVFWDSIVCIGSKAGKAYALPQDSTMVNYIWKNNSGIFSTALTRTGHAVAGLDPGDYSVRISASGGCDTTIAFTIEAYPDVQVTVDPDKAMLRYGDSIQLHASGALFYAWRPSGTVSNDTSASPFVRPLHPTHYTVMGLNEFGCRDTANVNIDIDYTMPQLIPNAFSPNGDGKNDVFKIEGITYQKLVAFMVFNRYGQQVFETIDPTKGWDGTQKGLPCNTDTYYYLISLNYPNGEMKTFKGDVVLLR